MIKRFNGYSFKIQINKDGYGYIIYHPDHKPSGQTIIRESKDVFDSEFRAHMAAIGHISLIHNGEE